MFCKKCVRNFTTFTGKHLYQSLFFNKVAGLYGASKGFMKALKAFVKHFEAPQRLANLLKKRFWRRCFPVNFVEFLRTPFFIGGASGRLNIFPVFLP